MYIPLVSIITPCFNSGKFIHRLLDSILNQTYKHIELICVDDGSTDDTREVILSYEERFREKGMGFLYLYQENKGQAAALNTGLQEVHGEFLTWPDSDDFLAETSIEKKVQFLVENPSYALVRTNGLFLDEHNLNPIRRVSDNPNRFDQQIFQKLFLLETFVCCGCYMIQFSSFLKAYPDCEIFESKEGQNFQMLLPLASFSPCGFIDEDLYFILERSDSHSRQGRTYNQELKRVEGIAEILGEAFRHSQCDFDFCMKEVAENNAKRLLLMSRKNHDRQVIEKSRTTLMRSGKIKNILISLVFFNSFFYKFAQVSYKVFKKWVHFIRGSH